MKLFLVAFLLLSALLTACTLITQFLAAIARRKIPPTGKFTEVTGGKIHWTDTGEGETILLLHGLGGNSHNFNYMILNKELSSTIFNQLFLKMRYSH